MSIWKALLFILFSLFIYVAWIILGGNNYEALALALVVFLVLLINPLNIKKMTLGEAMDKRYQYNKERIVEIEKEKLKHRTEQSKKRALEEMKKK